MGVDSCALSNMSTNLHRRRENLFSLSLCGPGAARPPPQVGLVPSDQPALTKTSGPQNSDAARGIELIAADTSIGEEPIEVLGDSAYGSGPMLAAVTAAGHVP